MANTELEKTIEELEAEVLSELEEANGDPSAPTKSAVPAEKMEKVNQIQKMHLCKIQVQL